MKTSRELKEKRGTLDARALEIRNKYQKKEGEPDIPMTEEDHKEFRQLINDIEDLTTQIEEAERSEKVLKTVEVRSQSTPTVPTFTKPTATLENDEIRAMQDFDFMKAVSELRDRGQVTGLEKEIITEGRSEAKEKQLGGISGMNIVIPSRFMEQRATVSQGTSDIKPTFVGAYTDALRERAIYQQLDGINVYNNLTGDLKLPVTTKQTLGWAASENAAAADGGSNFDNPVLSPNRITGYVDISNLLIAQNGQAASQAIAKDLGREEGQLINTAMFSTTSVANAPTSLPATSGVLTFTEEAAYAYGTSVAKDFLLAEQTVADNHGLDGALHYVSSTALLRDIKAGELVENILPLASGRGYNLYNINGYTSKITVGATKSAGVSADAIFGDFARVHFGRWGGLNILVDPFTVAGNDEVRLVVNSNVDWKLVQGAAFVKWTSLTA